MKSIRNIAKIVELISDTKTNEIEKQSIFYEFIKGKKGTIKKAQSLYTNYLNEVEIEGVDVDVSDLKPILKIKGTKYAIEPSFKDMSIGAFLDVQNLTKDNIHNNLHKIMAILYRPISVKIGKYYELVDYVDEKEYIKEQREQLFLDHFPYEQALKTAFFLHRSQMQNLKD